MDTTHQHKLLQLLLSPLPSCLQLYRRTAAAKFEEERLVETMSGLEEKK